MRAEAAETCDSVSSYGTVTWATPTTRSRIFTGTNTSTTRAGPPRPGATDGSVSTWVPMPSASAVANPSDLGVLEVLDLAVRAVDQRAVGSPQPQVAHRRTAALDQLVERALLVGR